MSKLFIRKINGTRIVDYMDRFSKCSNHINIDAVYYNYDNKWLCKECLEQELKRLKENEE